MGTDKGLVFQVLHIDDGPYLIIRRDLDQVLDGAALAGLIPFGDLINIQPVTAPHFREEKHGMMGRGHKKMLDIVLFPGPAATGPPASPALLTEFTCPSASEI